MPSLPGFRRAGRLASGIFRTPARLGGEQFAGVFVAGRVHDLRRGALFDDPAVTENDYAVADLRGQGQIVRDQKKRQLALFADVAKQRQDPGLGANVQRGQRLVGEQQARIHRQRARQGDPLALPPGKRCRAPVHLLRIQADAAQQRGPRGPSVLGGCTGGGSAWVRRRCVPPAIGD